MTLIAKLGLGTAAKVETKDTLGGYQPLASGVYPMTGAMIYLGESAGGSVSFNFAAKKADGGEYRETMYITTSRKEDKNGNVIEPKTTYTNNDGTFPLPGWTRANNICLAMTGKGIAEQETQPRSIELYNRKADKKIRTEVECLINLLDKPVQLGIERILSNKQKNVNNKWVDTPEVRTSNEITAVFTTTGMTPNEVADPLVTEPTFINAWRESKEGKDTNKVNVVKEAQAATVAASSAIDFNAKPVPAPAAQPAAQAAPVLPDPTPATAPAPAAPVQQAAAPAPTADPAATPVSFD